MTLIKAQLPAGPGAALFLFLRLLFIEMTILLLRQLDLVIS